MSTNDLITNSIVFDAVVEKQELVTRFGTDEFELRVEQFTGGKFNVYLMDAKLLFKKDEDW